MKPLGVKPEQKFSENGTKALLSTLFASGDNLLKLVVVVGLILNGIWSKKADTGTAENGKHLNELREQVAKQVDVVFSNQKVWAEFVEEVRQALDRIQTKEGITHPQYQPYPRKEVPDTQ